MQGTLIAQTRMRATIARRTVESKQRAPHFYVQTEVVLDRARDYLAGLGGEGDAARPTMTAALVRACVRALREEPQVNSVWTSEGLFQADDINIGIAIALDHGLIAPALVGADRYDLLGLAAALRDLAERARSNHLRPAEISDGTFTLSNLGMFDVSAFTAIITPPQVAILATGRPVARWELANGAPTCRSVMTATLSADHRAIDGVDAARFLEAFKKAIEDPGTLSVASDDPKESKA